MRTKENFAIVMDFMGYHLITPDMRKHPENWEHSYWEKDDEGDKPYVAIPDRGASWRSIDYNLLIEIIKKIDKDIHTEFLREGSEEYMIYWTLMDAVFYQDIDHLYENIVILLKWLKENKNYVK